MSQGRRTAKLPAAARQHCAHGLRPREHHRWLDLLLGIDPTVKLAKLAHVPVGFSCWVSQSNTHLQKSYILPAVHVAHLSSDPSTPNPVWALHPVHPPTRHLALTCTSARSARHTTRQPCARIQTYFLLPCTRISHLCRAGRVTLAHARALHSALAPVLSWVASLTPTKHPQIFITSWSYRVALELAVGGTTVACMTDAWVLPAGGTHSCGDAITSALCERAHDTRVERCLRAGGGQVEQD